MKKTIITIMLILLTISNIAPETVHSINGYRNPLGLLSWMTGTVDDADGNGTETTPFCDSYYNYIKYDPLQNAEGDTVFTVLVYNPLSLYHDDVICRMDF